MARNLTRSLFLPLLLSVAGGCAVSTQHLADAQTHVAHADWFQAWASIQAARAELPDDPQIEEAYWRIRTGWLLWRAQQFVFADREPEAVAELEKVLALDPEQPIALEWKRKAIEKLADREAHSGEQHRRAGELDEALRDYQEALEHLPGHDLASKGMADLSENWRSQRERARAEFTEGLRAMSEQLPQQAQYHFIQAQTLDPTLDMVSDPLRIVSDQLLAERILAARKMIDQRSYEAARRELETMQADHPDIPTLAPLLDVARREAEAITLKDDGQMAMAQGNLVTAREKLEAAIALTAQQKVEIGDLLLLLHEREIDNGYFAAKDVELQGRLDEALVAYGKLDERVPSFRDTRDRIADLRARIDGAKKAYEEGRKAEDGGDTATALSRYSDVRVYWPTYQDVNERIARLSAALRHDGD